LIRAALISVSSMSVMDVAGEGRHIA